VTLRYTAPPEIEPKRSPRASIALDPVNAERRAALAKTKAGPWTTPPESTRPPAAPSRERPIGGNRTTTRARAA